MGAAASAEEKMVHEILTRIAERRGEKFPSDALSRLLQWGRSRGLSVSPNTIFDKTVGADGL